ncbi:MAG: histidine triad nucleotide-binding protein, partial [bacterium]|nr:histidine triad nucleotide-binding protein [bacterium]
CDILAGHIPAEIVYQNDDVIAFKDIHPRAPVHVLVIPKEHIPTLNDLSDSHKSLIGELFLAATTVAKLTGIDQTGYRTVFNCHKDAGQEVYHIHLHVLGGRKMSWPPG